MPSFGPDERGEMLYQGTKLHEILYLLALLSKSAVHTGVHGVFMGLFDQEQEHAGLSGKGHKFAGHLQ